jgi:hypothetical protein
MARVTATSIGRPCASSCLAFEKKTHMLTVGGVEVELGSIVEVISGMGVLDGGIEVDVADGLLVGVARDVGVLLGTPVNGEVATGTNMTTLVGVAVGMGVLVGAFVDVKVAVAGGIFVGRLVEVSVLIGVGVQDGVIEGVDEGVAGEVVVAEGGGVLVGVFDGVGEGVRVAVVLTVGVIVAGSPTNRNVPEDFHCAPTKI